MSHLQRLDEMFDGASEIMAAFLLDMTPYPALTVTEWAERSRILPEETPRSTAPTASSGSPS